MIFHRYHNDEAATRSAFTFDGWFRTGDLGRIVDGRLTLVGRKKDSIVVNGVNYFSQELESTLEQLEGIDRSFVAAFPTRLRGADTEGLVIAFATTSEMSGEDRIYQLIVAVRNTTIMLWGFRPELVLPLPRAAFQKTSLGKIQRSIMRRRLEAGEFSSDVESVARLVERQRGSFSAPAGAVEPAIAQTFAEMLGLRGETVSATDNFFDLGGTSLEIIKLTRWIEHRFNLQLSLTTVLQNPTVRELAVHIDPEARSLSREYDPVVPMQITGKKTPVFCVHPGNGGVLAYVNLSKYFVNERPFYALRPRGFGEGESCFETFEEMEEAYLGGIRRYQPHGPYAIVGYSTGGAIAFEIAKALRASGERIAFLGCIDYHPLVPETTKDFPKMNFSASAIGLAWLLQLLNPSQLQEIRQRSDANQSEGGLCEMILAAALHDRREELGLDVSRFTTWTRVVSSLFKVCSQRGTSGLLDQMTIFRAGGDSQWRQDIKLWDNFVRDPRYIEAQGDHFTLMGPVHVSDFQALLRGEIDEGFRKLECV